MLNLGAGLIETLYALSEPPRCSLEANQAARKIRAMMQLRIFRQRLQIKQNGNATVVHERGNHPSTIYCTIDHIPMRCASLSALHTSSGWSYISQSHNSCNYWYRISSYHTPVLVGCISLSHSARGGIVVPITHKKNWKHKTKIK
jgi:hypothetical protein